MSIWTLTVIDGRDVVTTTHPSLAGAVACFSDNYDPEGEFPRTPEGVADAATAQGLHIDITEREL